MRLFSVYYIFISKAGNVSHILLMREETQIFEVRFFAIFIWFESLCFEFFIPSSVFKILMKSYTLIKVSKFQGQYVYNFYYLLGFDQQEKPGHEEISFEIHIL